MDAPGVSGRVVGAEIVSTSLPLRAPLRQPAQPGRAALVAREVVWLRLRGDDGTQGIGEASAVDWISPRNAGQTLRELRDLAAQIVATKPLASLLIERSFDVSLSSTARAGLQCAVLDLEARRRGVSLAVLLGAASDATLEVSALLPGDQALAVEEAARYAANGFRALKLKVGGTAVGEDIARVRDVIAAAAPQTRLRLDANRAWHAAEAEAALRALQGAGVDFIEEPLGEPSPHRETLLRGLRAYVAVAVDESICCERDLTAVIDANAADVLVLKLERVGGPLPALALAHTARRGGLRVVFTDSIESAVGRAATAHVAHAAGSTEALGLGGAFLLAAAQAAPDAVQPDVQPLHEGAAHDVSTNTREAATPQPLFVIRGPGLGAELSERER